VKRLSLPLGFEDGGDLEAAINSFGFSAKAEFTFKAMPYGSSMFKWSISGMETNATYYTSRYKSPEELVLLAYRWETCSNYRLFLFHETAIRLNGDTNDLYDQDSEEIMRAFIAGEEFREGPMYTIISSGTAISALGALQHSNLGIKEKIEFNKTNANFRRRLSEPIYLAQPNTDNAMRFAADVWSALTSDSNHAKTLSLSSYP